MVGRWGCEWPSWLETQNAWSKDGPVLGSNEPAYGAHGDVLTNQYRFGAATATSSDTLAQLIDDEQDDGVWPLEHPLPLPCWDEEYAVPYRVKNVREYETLACEIEMHLRKVLEEHNYDTIGNFLKFYDSFKKSSMDNLLEFFHL